jgi:hypothetical protein
MDTVLWCFSVVERTWVSIEGQICFEDLVHEISVR